MARSEAAQACGMEEVCSDRDTLSQCLAAS